MSRASKYPAKIIAMNKLRNVRVTRIKNKKKNEKAVGKWPQAMGSPAY
jgi:hypothetical protein